MFDFLKGFLPGPVVDIFLPIILLAVVIAVLYPRVMQKLREHGVFDLLLDKVGGEKLRLLQFEREIRALKKSGDVVGAARLYEEAEWYPEAIELYADAEEYNAAAAIYERLEQWEHAAEMYERAEDWRRAALTLTKVGKHAEAARRFEEHGQKIDAAKLYAEAGELAKAAELYTDVSYFPQAAKCYEKLGDYVRAAENYEAHWRATTSVGGGGLISQASDRESKVALHAGALYEKGGAPDRAAELYNRAGLSAQAAELAAKQGRFQDAAELLLRDEKLERAAEMFERAGETGRAALLLGEIAFHQGDLKTAADRFLEGGDNLRAAELYETCGELEAAARCYDESDAPLQAAGVYLRAGEKRKAAVMYERGGDHEQAATLFDEVQDRPKASELYERSGRFYEAGRLAQELGDGDRAIQLLQQVDASNEHYTAATLILARLFLEKNLPALAVDKLKRAIGSEPIGAATLEHFYCLGVAYEQLGKRDEAADTFRKVMTERYGYEDVEARLARLSGSAPGRAGAPHDDAPPPPASRAAAASAEEPASPGAPVAVAVPAPETDRPAPAPSPPAAPQAKSSPIEIGELLGEGLLGATYKGIDSRNRSPVAVKLLRRELLESADVAQRFLAEAKLARTLDHPALVRFLGIIDVDGSRAAVTEFVEGFSLQAFLDRNHRISVKQALDLLARLSGALGHAHERTLVHRDLKPANVLVAKGGQLKLAGFGMGALRLARLGRADGYPAPELLAGGPVGPSSDLYSLGALIFHALTSRNPADPGDGAMGLKQALPDAPDALDAVLARCLMPEPGSRFATAAELLEAVRTIAR